MALLKESDPLGLLGWVQEQASSDPQMAELWRMFQMLLDRRLQREETERQRALMGIGGLTAGQRAYAAAGPDRESRVSRLMAMESAGRRRLLREAGIDPSDPYVRDVNPQGRTPEEYVEAVRRAGERHAERKRQTAEKLRQQTAEDKRRAAGRVWSIRAVAPKPEPTKDRYQRAADAAAFVQGRRTPQTPQEWADFQAALGGEPLPARRRRYEGYVRVGVSGQPPATPSGPATPSRTGSNTQPQLTRHESIYLGESDNPDYLARQTEEVARDWATRQLQQLLALML